MDAAIVTKVLVATSHRGRRVKVATDGGLQPHKRLSQVVSWNEDLSTDDNHHVAAKLLARKMWPEGNIVMAVAALGNGFVYSRVRNYSYPDNHIYIGGDDSLHRIYPTMIMVKE